MRKQRVISTLSAAIVLWVSVAGMGRAGEHLVPADKGLTSAYLQGLRERGQRAVYAADEADTLDEETAPPIEYPTLEYLDALSASSASFTFFFHSARIISW